MSTVQNFYNAMSIISIVVTMLATIPLVIQRWRELFKKKILRDAIRNDRILKDVDGVDADPEEADADRVAKVCNKRASGKDLTRYSLDGEGSYGKGRLVLAVIKKYVQKKPCVKYSELVEVFPKTLRGLSDNAKTYWGCVNLKRDAEDLYEDTGRCRHFLNDDDVIRLSDGNEVVVSSQWGVGNIGNFIAQAEKLGFKVRTVDM